MSVMLRPDSGTKTRAASRQDVNKHIDDLQQQLTRSRAETQRARDKLNCLISLVRRSWNGDRNASIHLANIIGLDIPQALLDSGTGTAGRPGTSMHTHCMGDVKTPAVVNWERLAVKLLRRDYEEVQAEIREHQQRYIENRSRFMDEVMHFHHQDMAQTPISRPTSAKLGSVDQQFLQMHSLVRNDGKNEARQRLHRPKSSVLRARPKAERDLVQQAEVKLRDLFVDSTNPAALHFAMPAADAALGGKREKEVVRQRPVRQDYGDTTRYVQGNLFRAEELVTKKVRPMSAAVLQEKDRIRARPRSAVTLTMEGADSTTKNRPLKYETTRPVSGKKLSSAKFRRASVPSTDTAQLNISANANGNTIGVEPPHNPDVSMGDTTLEEQEDMWEPAETQPPISVRVKNAITRPECVDKFSQDLRTMEEMEAAFKMNTLALQKKLGLPESGIV